MLIEKYKLIEVPEEFLFPISWESNHILGILREEIKDMTEEQKKQYIKEYFENIENNLNKMINENKYYIPDISEFYVGFEYELFHNFIKYKYINEGAGQWNKHIYNELDFIKCQTLPEFKLYSNFSELILNKEIRVPYLTKEDIENEGFILKHTSIDLWFETPEERDFDKINYRLESGHYVSKWKINYGLHDCRMKIIADFITNEDTFFEGYIKNKNEFKKLLTWLKIK